MEQIIPDQSDLKEMDPFGHIERWSSLNLAQQEPCLSSNTLKQLRTDDDKSVAGSNTDSVVYEAYNEKVIKSEL